jgi:hypothetical protein
MTGASTAIWKSRNQGRNTMRKQIYISATCALAAATIFVWSQNALVSSRTDSASVPVVAQGSLLAPEAATSSMTSPTEMMINYSKPLPVEQWDAY